MTPDAISAIIRIFLIRNNLNLANGGLRVGGRMEAEAIRDLSDLIADAARAERANRNTREIPTETIDHLRALAKYDLQLTEESIEPILPVKGTKK